MANLCQASRLKISPASPVHYDRKMPFNGVSSYRDRIIIFVPALTWLILMESRPEAELSFQPDGAYNSTLRAHGALQCSDV